jgi:hypothetical protein
VKARATRKETGKALAIKTVKAEAKATAAAK